MSEATVFKRSQLADRQFYNQHRTEIIQALKEGRVVDDVTKAKKTVEEQIAEVEAISNAVIYEEPKEIWFKTSQLAKMKTAKEYHESGAAVAVAAGRVIDDTSPSTQEANERRKRNVVTIVESGGAPRTPLWMQAINREADEKQVELAAKAEAERSVVQKHLERLIQERGANDAN